MTRPIRIAISGAASQTGYALVFRIAAGGLFGAEQSVALNLLDFPKQFALLEAIEMELRDCAFPLLAELNTSVDAIEAFDRADWVILLAGRSQLTEKDRRIDMIRENSPVFMAHGRAINESAPEARVLVAASPCNTNCLIAKAHAQDVPAERWFGLTRLDRMRAAGMLAEKAGVHVSQVTRVTIWGNQSELAYPDFRNAWVGERPAREVITDREWVRQVFEPSMAQRTSEIFRRRGALPAGSAAQAIVGTIRSITTPTPYDRRFGAAVASDGSYGVPRGLIFGFPLRTEDGESWSIVQGLYLDSYAQSRIVQNVAELEREAASLTDLVGSIV